MSTPIATTTASPEAPLYVPAGWTPRPQRDTALDLIRGLAMTILVVNHLHLESPLEDGTSAVVSAAEVLVLVSGVVAGMVFGRRWRSDGPRATTRAILSRARQLYVASVAVVVLVGLLTLVPGAATEHLTRTRGVDTYAFGGVADALWSVLTLAAGPWQFNILGFFVTVIALTPLLLAALARGWWPAVAVGSLALYLAGRAWEIEVLPSQSERPFPLLVWQILFVGGVLVGWHRASLERVLARGGASLAAGVVAAAAVAGAILVLGPGIESAWAERHFDKDTLDPLRLLAMTTFAGALYVALGRAPAAVARLLTPFGRNSFYVFIVQVFLCLALASAPAIAGDGLGPAGNVAVQLGALGLLWLMVTRGVLFRWIPR